MSTCNWLGLELLGCQLIMPNNLYRHHYWFISNDFEWANLGCLKLMLVSNQLSKSNPWASYYFKAFMLDERETSKLYTISGCLCWMKERERGTLVYGKGHFTHEPKAVTLKLWEPKRKCPKAVPTHLPNHEVWSRTLKCSVKSYVPGPSTKCYFNEFLFTRVLTHDKIE